MYYFDYCSSMPLYPEVYKVLLETSKSDFANPSSPHLLGLESSNMVETARKNIAQLLSLQPHEVIFTSGATESNNLALIGTVKAARKKGRKKVHIITSMVEHASVFNVCKYMESEGVEVTYLPVNKYGMISVDVLRNCINENTILVSIMDVNNETGTIQPINEIGKLLNEYKEITFHVDGAQGFSKTPNNFEYIDMYTISGHKIGAPKGVGILVKKDNVELIPLFFGGGQEEAIRPGTTNVPSVIAMAEAIKISLEGMSDRHKFFIELNSYLRSKLSNLDGIVINSPQYPFSSSHILNLSSTVEGMNSAILVSLLSKKGIFVSSQSACSSKSKKVSRVLMEMTKDELISTNSLRLSFHESSSFEDADYLVNSMSEIIKHINEKGRFSPFVF